MPLPRAELLRHLDEQTRFLRKSAQEFDRGDRSEAKRIAVQLRILLDGRGRNAHPLLGEIVDLQAALFPCVNEEPGDQDALMQTALLYGIGGNGLEPLTRMSGRREPFPSWWTEPCEIYSGFTITRETCVRDMANQGGGAHVDPREGNSYRKFAETNELGWTVFELGRPGSERPDPDLNNPLPAIVRATAAEVLNFIGAADLT